MSTTSTWLGTTDLSAELGISLRTLYRFINSGELRAHRFGRVFRVRRADVDHWLKTTEVQPGDLDHLLPPKPDVEES